MVISEEISSSLSIQQEGKLLFPKDFYHLGSPEAVNMAFSRMSRNKKLIRLAKGIYLYPKVDATLGTLIPPLEDIAQKIAEKENVLIRPTGSYALNRLGLSTQVPTKVVYLTNGSRRRIKVGKGTITFKSTTPKNLAAKSELVFLTIQALIELGEKEGTSLKTLTHLRNKLAHTAVNQIRSDAKTAPIWIAKFLYSLTNQLENNG